MCVKAESAETREPEKEPADPDSGKPHGCLPEGWLAPSLLGSGVQKARGVLGDSRIDRVDNTSLLGEEWDGGCTAENGTSTVTATPGGKMIPENSIFYYYYIFIERETSTI